MLQLRPLAALGDNYIWLLHDASQAIVIDPGDAAPVIAALDAANLTLAGIFITHHHADHQGGSAALIAHSSCPVYGPAGESITGLSQPLSGGEEVEIPGLARLQVLAVPGHTRGHLAYRCADWLFCGDTLFAAGCGRLFEGTPAEMLASLHKLAALPDATQVCCAHEYTATNLRFAATVEPDNPAIARRIAEVAALRAGNQPSLPSSLGLEKATNPFLRCREPAVIAAAQRRAPQAASELAVFTAIRSWRNEF